MPPLRPLPSQSLRPAWSASQLCRGAAARLPRTHSFRAADARSFASTSDNATNGEATTRGSSEASAEVDKGVPSTEEANLGDETVLSSQSGHRLAPLGDNLDPYIRKVFEVKGPTGTYLKAVGERKKDRMVTAATQTVQQDSLIRTNLREEEKPREKPRKSPGKSLRMSPRESDRLQRLARMGSSLTANIERSDGKKIRVITNDVIMDDSTWRSLKEGLNEVAEESSSSAAWESTRRGPGHLTDKKAESRSGRNVRSEEQGSELETQDSGLKFQEPGPKLDSMSVKERLRDAIGNIRSSLSAELEDHTQPSRYRQDTRPADRYVHDQRLDELEALLIQASRRLQELRGCDMGEELKPDGESVTDVWSSLTPRQRRRRRQTRKRATAAQRGMSGSYATEDVESRGDADYTSHDPNAPVHYLSRDPSRPLPHTTGRAIPPTMFGPRASLRSDEKESQRGSPSLWNGGASEDIGVSKESSKKSEEETPGAGPSLADEILQEKADLKLSKRQKQQASLLGELFPELADNSPEVQHNTHEEREVPKLSLDFHQEKPERRPQFLQRKEFIDKQMQARYLNELVVIHLSGFSKHLSEEDIKRLVPSSSKYIEGWSDPDFIKAFPVRDERILERLDQYYVLFRNVRAARDFQENVRKLHLLVKSHTPTSLSSALPLPPGFTDDKGVDLHAALHSYTIGPPITDRIYCNVVPTPYPKDLRHIFLAGGYEPIVNHQSKPVGDPNGPHEPSAFKVLFHVEGAQPTHAEVRNTIARDGKDRGLPWAIVGGTNGRDSVVRLTTHLARNEAVGDDVNPLMARKVAPRYVIAFENKAEAQRFVRRWHRMPFMWSVGGLYENGEGPPQAKAEFLW